VNKPASAPTQPSSSPIPTARGFRRFGAFVHEGFFLIAVIFIAQLFVTRLAGGEFKGIWRSVSQAFLLLVLGIYFVWQWTHGRRTLALKTWGLRLLTREGGIVTLRHALLRYAALWIGPGLALLAYTQVGKGGLILLLTNFVWALFDHDKQTLHDRLASTRLVRAD
jgi:uncharacterized RDD family membrane protein YckC